MTVSTTHRFNPFTPNGINLVFGFTFRCDDAAWISVLLDNVVVGGYTVFVNADQTASPGGTVTFAVAPVGTLLIVQRNAELTQETVYNPYGRFPAKSHETALDKLTVLVQDFAELATRVVKSAIGSPPVNITYPPYVANKIWTWDPLINGKVINTDGSVESVAAAAASAAAALASQNAALASQNTAAASYDSFDDRYLGPKAAAPALDNDGNALLVGALYWNSTNNTLNVWTGAVWTSIVLDAAGVNLANAFTGANTHSGAETFASLTLAIGATGNVWSPGDLKGTIRAAADSGWVLMNDGTIGNASSGASTRANADTVYLFTETWNNITNARCPIYDSAGAVSTRGASAAADFAANKRLRLLRIVGRALIGAGSAGAYSTPFTADAGTDVCTVDSNLSLYTGAIVQVASVTTLPAGLAAATDYYVIRTAETTLKLATSLANAHASTAIDITDAGTGAHTMTMSLTSRTLGEHVGEEAHSQTSNENGPHTHDLGLQFPGVNASGGTGAFQPTGTTFFTLSSGLGAPHNNMQPATAINVMIKL